MVKVVKLSLGLTIKAPRREDDIQIYIFLTSVLLEGEW
jgi:hypothetical protein